MVMRNKVLIALAASWLAGTASGQAQQGAPDASTIKGTANSVTEPFDGTAVPATLLAVPGDPYSLAGHGQCAASIGAVHDLRSAGRRVGKASARTSRSRWSPDPKDKNTSIKQY